MKTNPVSIFKTSLLLVIGSLVILNPVFASDKLYSLSVGEHRSDNYIARNEFRHPVETLRFFGIKENMTVAEISPGGGWYAEILAPYLMEKGQYIAASYDPQAKLAYYRRNAKILTDKFAADPTHYAKVKTTIMQVPEKVDFAPENSVDMVVSFRNAHNWAEEGHADKAFAAIYKVIKPNGVFGLVQHRAGVSHPKDTSGKLGYLKTAEVIRMVEQAGFRLIEQSEINANPKDSKDYKEGVWTLPPSYRLKDKDRAKYKAIGETDRMTLKFVKPASK
jgi:predicted methyltransferase